MSFDRRPWGLYGYVALVYLFIFAPIVLVVVNSFNSDQSLVGWGGFTLRWYGVFIVVGAIAASLIAASEAKIKVKINGQEITGQKELNEGDVVEVAGVKASFGFQE